MSVLVKDFLTLRYKAFVKGSPERLKDLCLPSSLPADFDDVLHSYTRNGFRVLAFAFKHFDYNSTTTYLQMQRI